MAELKKRMLKTGLKEFAMKKNTIIIMLIIILLIPALFITGCQKTPEIPTATGTFEATYILENGRSFSISGESDGMPGEQSEYVLKIHNNAERWQDEYSFLLIDSDSVIQEISHEWFDIPAGDGIEKPFTVEFPEGYEGTLGLCVMTPQGGPLIATLSVGEKHATSTSWPDIRSLR